jgi:hypothetical protein
MHISPTAAPAPQHTPEPPRPAQQEAQVSSRPVVEASQAEASAQETRRHDERRADRADSKQQHDLDAKRAAAQSHAESKHRAESHSHRHSDSSVGSKVDVFA